MSNNVPLYYVDKSVFENIPDLLTNITNCKYCIEQKCFGTDYCTYCDHDNNLTTCSICNIPDSFDEHNNICSYCNELLNSQLKHDYAKILRHNVRKRCQHIAQLFVSNRINPCDIRLHAICDMIGKHAANMLSSQFGSYGKYIIMTRMYNVGYNQGQLNVNQLRLVVDKSILCEKYNSSSAYEWGFITGYMCGWFDYFDDVIYGCNLSDVCEKIMHKRPKLKKHYLNKSNMLHDFIKYQF
jgi:hypothetical protein